MVIDGTEGIFCVILVLVAIGTVKCVKPFVVTIFFSVYSLAVRLFAYVCLSFSIIFEIFTLKFYSRLWTAPVCKPPNYSSSFVTLRHVALCFVRSLDRALTRSRAIVEFHKIPSKG